MDITESRKVINLIKNGEDIPTYKVGEAMGYSRQSINNKLKSDTLRFSEIIAVLKHFGHLCLLFDRLPASRAYIAVQQVKSFLFPLYRYKHI